MASKNDKVFDFVAHEEKIDKLIKRSFSSSFMSNAKWRKCFTLLDSKAPDIQLIWKFIGSQNEGVRYGIPPIEALEEKYINSRFWYGPMYYKEIEWVEFPCVGKPYGKEQIPGAHFDQDIEEIRKELENIGSWQIEVSTEGFKLYGFKQ